ncbi:hypothetical protein PWY87_13390 [Kribbella solani]|uniref:hypothetical protein n=1 Tax=Kribbella solani TaxID=236067 RepID=UPI0029B7C1E8|nr:hypothetical protein [Kribbella solani]MDX3002674.1 hypothetical protein [Kribbella solani]
MLSSREAAARLVDYTRPLLLGYLRRDLHLSDRQVDEQKIELGAFAVMEGFTLGTVYVEDAETAPAAYGALVESVNRYEVTAVVIPDLSHLALIGEPVVVKGRFERATGARIMLPVAS